MMFVNFKAEHQKEYKILRDYRENGKEVKGIYFILLNEESGETFDRFLRTEYINNKFNWQKIKNGDVEYQSYGIEAGDCDKLIVETGILTAEKKGVVGQKKSTTFTARRFKYIFAK